ncbi:MAG: hypothetical protein AAF492_12595, partial [Verrucomicrobiota bacterium]
MKWLNWTMLFLLPAVSARADFRAGAAVTDITPTNFPVYVAGSFFARTATSVNTPLHARSIAFDDGEEKIVIVIVDSCMVPRTIYDEAKKLASAATGIAPSKMLMAATHTHSAPACGRALGTPGDTNYPAFLVPRLARAVEEAVKHLEPARVGSAVIDAGAFTAVRRWVRRPDKVELDPFGNPTVRANMHLPTSRSPIGTGPSGPEDPDLSVLAVQALDGRPIALLANFANHSHGEAVPLSADYFGLFADRVEAELGR